MALRITITHMNKISICDAINAHLHDRFVAHANLNTAITTRSMAVLAAATHVLALASMT